MVIKLRDKVWGYSCSLKTYGIVHAGVCCVTSVLGRAAGRRTSPALREARAAVSSLLAATFSFYFFSPSQSQWGDLHIKVPSIFFRLTDLGFCMSMSNFGNRKKKNHICLKDIGT